MKVYIKASLWLASLGLLAALPAEASFQRIHVENLSYPTTASWLLNQIQQLLAAQAILACQSIGAVVGLNHLEIHIEQGVPGAPVAALQPADSATDPALQLSYPKFKATAIVQCAD